MDQKIQHAVLLPLRLLSLFLLASVLLIGHQLEIRLLFVVTYLHLPMTRVAVRILGGLQIGIAAKAVIYLTESILVRIGTKRRAGIGNEETTLTESSGIEIGTEQGAETEIEIMKETESADVIMIEAGILKGTVAEGIETMEDIESTVLKEVEVEVGATSLPRPRKRRSAPGDARRRRRPARSRSVAGRCG